MDLTGKRILVAGAISETGQAIVKQLDSLGAQVVLVDTSEEKLKEIKFNLDLVSAEISSFNIYENKEIEPNFKKIVSLHGAFNGFVFCAGIGGVRPLSLTKLSFVAEMMNANVYSFIEMVRCITKRNCFVQGGSIVAISSVSSIKGLKSKTAYCASKAALDAAVRCMATELSDKGIRVNSILKGWVTSDMKSEFIKNNLDLNGGDDYKRQLLGPVKPCELANTVAFLLGDVTKSITGTSLLLDGGYTL